MHTFWTSLMHTAMRRTDDVGVRTGPGLGRLLLEEVGWAVRQAIHPAKMGAAALVVIGVGVALGPTTPGPVLGAGWRLAVSVVLGFITLSVAHALLQRRQAEREEPLQALRVVVATVALLFAAAVILAQMLAVITGSSPDSTPSALSVSLPIDIPLLAGGVLLAIGVVAAGVSYRLAVPGALLFLALGMIVGSDGFGWVQLQDAGLVQSLGVAALVVILFDGGVTTDVHQLRRGVGPGLALATVGVAITAGITALGTMWLLGVPSRVAWLIGAIVSSTDAAAVFSLLRRAPLPGRLASILQIESGANDPVAVLLTVGLLAAWDAPPTASAWLSFGALQLIGGVAVGVACGWAGSWLMRRVMLGADGLYPVLALALAGVTYGAAVAIGASGFLAVYLAGIVIASEAPRRRRSIRSFLSALAGGTEVGLFLLLGLLVNPLDLLDVSATALGVVVLLLFVARPVACAVTLAWFDMRPREVVAVSWLGLRGAVPIVLATLALSAGIAEASLIFDLVFFVVLASALLQGASAIPLLRGLGLDAPTSAGRSIAEAIPLDEAGVDIIEVSLDPSSPLVNRDLRSCEPPDGVLVTAVLRGDDVILPRGSSRLLAGDRLVIATTDRREGLSDVQDWAHPVTVD